MIAVVVAGVVVFAVVAVREWRAEGRRQQARMYADRRPAPSVVVDQQVADARLDYFARRAPKDEIRQRTRDLESFELDRAAARVVAEMAAEADAQSTRRRAEIESAPAGAEAPGVGAPAEPAPAVATAAADVVDAEPEPEPERPAALTKPAAQPAANRGGRQQKVTDDQLVAAVREHGPTGTSALCQVLDYGSHGSLHARLTRLVAAGRVEKVGTTWRIPQTIAAARPPASTGSAAVPSKPGTGVDPGPITRKPFDPEAARLRAAGEL